jgi:uncharacterized heparinase superfamily protein
VINVQFMKLSQTLQHSDQHHPNFTLVDINSLFLVLAYFLKQISIVSVFHDYTSLVRNRIISFYHRDLDFSSQKASL